MCTMHWLVFPDFHICVHVYIGAVSDERTEKRRHCCWASRRVEIAEFDKLPESLCYLAKKRDFVKGWLLGRTQRMLLLTGRPKIGDEMPSEHQNR